MWRVMSAMWLVVVLFGIGELGSQPLAIDEATITYDDFMKLDENERESTLARMPTERKIMLKRVHAERWLDRNRASLSTSQVALVQEAIDFLSPERYQNPQDPELIKQEAAIAHRLACSLGEHRALAAFTFRAEKVPRGRSWSSLLDSWAQWLVECVMP